MLLYFAGQGAGRVMWPVLGGTVRLLIAAGLGWTVVVGFGGGLRELFIAGAVGSIVSGAIVASALCSVDGDRRLFRQASARHA